MRDSEIDRSESESSACPRCSTGDARVVARSPRPGVRSMHLCTVCFYTWRSTEPDYAIRAEVLSPGFRIDPSRLGEGRAMPEVPPLRDAPIASGRRARSYAGSRQRA
jgi:vanillate/4-hydroxybenzoate decarboxylase subunit D